MPIEPPTRANDHAFTKHERRENAIGKQVFFFIGWPTFHQLSGRMWSVLSGYPSRCAPPSEHGPLAVGMDPVVGIVAALVGHYDHGVVIVGMDCPHAYPQVRLSLVSVSCPFNRHVVVLSRHVECGISAANCSQFPGEIWE